MTNSILLNSRVSNSSNLQALQDHLVEISMPSHYIRALIHCAMKLETHLGTKELVRLVRARVPASQIVRQFVDSYGKMEKSVQDFIRYAIAHYAKVVDDMTVFKKTGACERPNSVFMYNQLMADRAYASVKKNARTHARTQKGDGYADSKSYTAYMNRLIKTGGMNAYKAYERASNGGAISVSSKDAPPVGSVSRYPGIPPVFKGHAVVSRVTKMTKKEIQKMQKNIRFGLQVVDLKPQSIPDDFDFLDQFPQPPKANTQ